MVIKLNTLYVKLKIGTYLIIFFFNANVFFQDSHRGIMFLENILKIDSHFTLEYILQLF